MLSIDELRNVSDIKKISMLFETTKLQLDETFHNYKPASHLDSIDKMR